MNELWWTDAKRWPTPTPPALAVTGWAYALGAMSRDAALASVRHLDLAAEPVPDVALGHYPMAPGELEPFLQHAGAAAGPEVAAREATRALVARRAAAHPVDLASNVLDVWRHAHALFDTEARHAGRCSCVVNCPHTPGEIRDLDDAVQAYYEAHHAEPAPECFGWSDPEHGRKLQELLARAERIT